jgi:hypothetical protein
MYYRRALLLHSVGLLLFLFVFGKSASAECAASTNFDIDVSTAACPEAFSHCYAGLCSCLNASVGSLTNLSGTVCLEAAVVSSCGRHVPCYFDFLECLATAVDTRSNSSLCASAKDVLEVAFREQRRPPSTATTTEVSVPTPLDAAGGALVEVCREAVCFLNEATAGDCTFVNETVCNVLSLPPLEPMPEIPGETPSSPVFLTLTLTATELAFILSAQNQLEALLSALKEDMASFFDMAPIDITFVHAIEAISNRRSAIEIAFSIGYRWLGAALNMAPKAFQTAEWLRRVNASSIAAGPFYFGSLRVRSATVAYMNVPVDEQNQDDEPNATTWLDLPPPVDRPEKPSDDWPTAPPVLHSAAVPVPAVLATAIISLVILLLV